jgi:hypothetical protein
MAGEMPLKRLVHLSLIGPSLHFVEDHNADILTAELLGGQLPRIASRRNSPRRAG